MLCLDGQHHAVSYVDVAHWSTRVYNFEVEKDHDYFVSKFKVLAHNTCGNPSNGLGVNDPPTRVQGPWTERDLARAEEGKGPLDMTPKTDKMALRSHSNSTTPIRCPARQSTRSIAIPIDFLACTAKDPKG